MKYYTFILVSFLMTCALSLSSVQTGHAQGDSFTQNIYTPPTGNFVDVEEAQERLIAEMTELKTQMASQTPGTLGYKENQRKLVYFHEITLFLKSGSGVPDSIVSGLGVFATALYGNITRDKKIQLKELAILVLTV